MEWRNGKNSERVVRCDGCGGTRTVCECTVSGPTHDVVFACSHRCERLVEEYGPGESPLWQEADQQEYEWYKSRGY